MSTVLGEHANVQMFVLAGGAGTRLRSRLNGVPKAMAEVSGRPFLSIFFDFWIDRGISEFVVGTGYLADQIVEHFGSKYRSVPIAYSLEQTPIGTGGSVALAIERRLFNDAFFVANGDTLVDVSLSELLMQSAVFGADLVLSARAQDNERGRYGELIVSGGTVRSLGVDHGDAVHQDGFLSLANAGLTLFGPSTEDFLRSRTPTFLEGSSLELDVIPRMLEQGMLARAVVSDGFFCDIGIPNDYDQFRENFAAGRVPLTSSERD